jgi:MarR family 2-MHQ and catechol resistance regulon transcriptional repressor
MENITKSSAIRSTDGTHLWLILWKASRSVERAAHASIEAAGLGLTDFAILEALLHKGPLPVNAFREKVLLSSGSMTAAIDRLEKAGFVERRSTKEDRRTRLVHLTAKGRKQIEPVFARHRRDMEEAFACLNPTQRDVLGAMLRKLGEHANKFTNNADNVR